MVNLLSTRQTCKWRKIHGCAKYLGGPQRVHTVVSSWPPLPEIYLGDLPEELFWNARGRGHQSPRLLLGVRLEESNIFYGSEEEAWVPSQVKVASSCVTGEWKESCGRWGPPLNWIRRLWPSGCPGPLLVHVSQSGSSEPCWNAQYQGSQRHEMVRMEWELTYLLKLELGMDA